MNISFGWVIKKWRWWIWMVAAYRWTHSTSCLAWSEGWQPSGAKSIFIKWLKVKRVNSRNGSEPCWQHHKYCHICYYYMHIHIQATLPSYMATKWLIHWLSKGCTSHWTQQVNLEMYYSCQKCCSSETRKIQLHNVAYSKNKYVINLQKNTAI